MRLSRPLLRLGSLTAVLAVGASCVSAPPSHSKPAPLKVAPAPAPPKLASASSVKVAAAPPVLTPAPPKPDETPAPKVLPNGIRVAWASKTTTEPVIDGDLAEWGTMPQAPSVTLSVNKDGAYLVANLAGVTKDGIWIEISVPVTELHPLGSWGRDGSFYNFNAPEYEKSMKKVLENHARFVEKHQARFQKIYRLDSKGIQWSGKKGLEPVPGAIVVSKVVQHEQGGRTHLVLANSP